MNRSLPLIAWIIASFALSTYALVIIPQHQIGGLQPQFVEEEGKVIDIYPIQNLAMEKGRAVYKSEGCVYCHSQQVRDPQNGTDLERGWGERRTVARDYIFEQPSFLGSTRLGPDLANAGSPKWRNEDLDDPRKPVKRDRAWHLLHLYHPTAVITESNMPPYRYLFEKRKISGQQSADALNLSGADAPEPGYEIVPKAEAKALADYLLSLNRSHPLNEVKSAAAEAPKK
ncbi:MAG: cytochrome c oxidase cbb3-type subunit [Chthoniobacter sp.]|jgi:cytochrome c oxidase cbb3-type subunit 2|nr:cytochrome c oxidase cbb3-type subunit [Chthoniobacter sp.]